ncbi:LysM peptidoglycan-binding domain-containing protein [Allosediminivita pacifica]|uniref:Nucleoid-associated protein YgaU n=1 Tax=Allosediminivita pacifica TaxID=1267769 RepID=A0A2T6ARN5_9RHOB|nr:LysM peptidoglycan-binding domain-containing protein [Allosediminivita pacifica]PTX46488.1 nucleoid-associated protein YgaU [Allosediminivita pacifica]GGB16778.1 hypothetical protein GCM10011324_28790 [Allosediminivita pacifica]
MGKAAVQAGFGAAVLASATVLAVNSGWIDLSPGSTPQEAGEQQASATAAAPQPDTASEAQPVESAAAVVSGTTDRGPARPDPDSRALAPLQPGTGASVSETSRSPAETAQDNFLPRFDLVRADPDGTTVVAGSAVPGSEVTLLVDGTETETATAGSDGTFVLFTDLTPEGLARVLTLATGEGADRSTSRDEIIIAPAAPRVASAPQAGSAPQAPGTTGSATLTGAASGLADPAAAPSDPTLAEGATPAPRVSQPGDRPAAAEGEQLALAGAPQRDGAPGPATAAAPAGPQAAGTAPTPAEGLPPTPDTSATPREGSAPGAGTPAEIALASDAQPGAQPPQGTTAPDRTGEPTVLVSGPAGVEVLPSSPLGPSEIALDAVGYDAEGEVFLTGRGLRSAFLRIYLDNTPVTTSRIREDGGWRVELPQVGAGTYTLRVDQLDESGAVTARVESPFQREAREILATATQGRQGPVTAVTVQPGDTLWAISRDRYGEGIEYVRVYQANTDQIRDPDLIYPGQVFSLPEGE